MAVFGWLAGAIGGAAVGAALTAAMMHGGQRDAIAPVVSPSASAPINPFAAAEARVKRVLANPRSVRFSDEMHGLKVPRAVCGSYAAVRYDGGQTDPTHFIVVEDALYLRMEGDPEGFDRTASLVGC